MKSMKAGAILLSIWTGSNLLIATAVTVMTIFGRTPPILALLFSETEIQQMDRRLVAVVNAQAALANPCIVAFGLLVLVVVWKGLVGRARWALWALVGSTVPLQVFGFVSDAFIGHRHLAANVVSSVVLCAGLALCGYGFTGPRAGARA